MKEELISNLQLTPIECFTGFATIVAVAGIVAALVGRPRRGETIPHPGISQTIKRGAHERLRRARSHSRLVR